MNYQIITDSCCDFTDQQYRDMHVTAVPLTVMWGGQCHSHFSSEEALKDFYRQMRSGRLSAASAVVGTVLDIKPIIRVTEQGKLVSTARVRGRKASIHTLAKKFAEAHCPEDAAALASLLRKDHGIRNIHIGYVGPILGAHTGPGVLGLLHLGTKR